MVLTDLMWGAILLAAAGLQTWAIRSDGRGAFSNLVRRVFRTDTTRGRVVFLVVWALFAVWFGVHIALRIF